MLAFLFSALIAVSSADLPLVFEEDFSMGADRWLPTDGNAWKVVKTDKGSHFSQFQASKFEPPYRSPFNFARIKGLELTDFDFTARLQSTIKDYPHRDMVVVFGYQDPAHFYYVHLGKKTDDHANQIFIVNKAPRVKISTRTTPGTPWTDAWHTVRITRDAASGKIAIYFDDLEKPIMEATDKTFSHGQIGVGSFDDTGNWTDIKIRGKKK